MSDVPRSRVKRSREWKKKKIKKRKKKRGTRSPCRIAKSPGYVKYAATDRWHRGKNVELRVSCLADGLVCTCPIVRQASGALPKTHVSIAFVRDLRVFFLRDDAFPSLALECFSLRYSFLRCVRKHLRKNDVSPETQHSTQFSVKEKKRDIFSIRIFLKKDYKYSHMCISV